MFGCSSACPARLNYVVGQVGSVVLPKIRDRDTGFVCLGRGKFFVNVSWVFR